MEGNGRGSGGGGGYTTTEKNISVTPEDVWEITVGDGGDGGAGADAGYNHGGSGIVIVRWLKTDSLNETITRDLGAENEEDLSGHAQVKFWIKSTRTGTYLQFGMGTQLIPGKKKHGISLESLIPTKMLSDI